jgi:hypothetical protein
VRVSSLRTGEQTAAWREMNRVLVAARKDRDVESKLRSEWPGAGVCVCECVGDCVNEQVVICDRQQRREYSGTLVLCVRVFV